MGKKPEDNRDVFDKALDDDSLGTAIGGASGAILGALVGSVPGSKQARRILNSKSTKPFTQAEIDVLNKTDRYTLPKMLAGGVPGMLAGASVGGAAQHMMHPKKPRK